MTGTASEADGVALREDLERAAVALAEGRWQDARAGFESTLAVAETGEALFGLALARWWLAEPASAIELEERAFAVFRRAGDHEQAFNAALYLCLGHNMTFGNTAAARGWLERASRIVTEHDLAHLRGWMLLCRAVTEHDDGDMVSAEKWAREALVLAGEFSDRDLEVCSRSELGAALVEQGRLGEGCPLLDDAMAGALGGDMEVLDSVVLASCRTIAACSRAGDVRRAAQWIRASEAFNQRVGSPHLHTTCRTYHAHALFLAGNWEQAEAELLLALDIGVRAEPLLHATALASLAELRLAQGRPDEAARALAGHEGRAVTLPTWAAVLTARGEAVAAAELLRRRLDTPGASRLQEVRLRARLVAAELAAGDAEAARETARELFELAGSMDVPVATAYAQESLGLAELAGGDPAGARRVEQALAGYLDLEMPYDAARCRLTMARQPGLAVGAAAADARSAMETFERLGAVAAADQAAHLLRSLGVRAARRGPNAAESLTGREREILALLAEGLSNREMAGRLFISPKTVEHHVARVLTKLGLHRRAEATAWAARNLGSD